MKSGQMVSWSVLIIENSIDLRFLRHAVQRQCMATNSPKLLATSAALLSAYTASASWGT
jgi:hypothetical protein